MDRPERALFRFCELLVIAIASIFSPIAFVLVSGLVIKCTRPARSSASLSKLRPLLIAIGIVLIVAVVVLPAVSLTKPWVVFDPNLVGWCSAFPQSWALACAFPRHASGAAIVATLVTAFVSAAAYRDAVQLGGERQTRVWTTRTHMWIALIAFAAWCVANTALGAIAGFVGHPASGSTSDYVFFLTVTCLLAWALHALTRELLATMVGLLR